MDKGYIKSPGQKVLEFFPDYVVKKREQTIQQITLEHMLTMTAPYKFRFNPYTKYFTSQDWVEASLDLLGGKGKIGEFKYAPVIGPDILSGILVKTTGRSVLEFARENLFTPLGISVGQSIIFQSKEEQMDFYKKTGFNGWVAGPTGVNTAAWGLTLTASDMARIGQLYLNGGMWEGRRLVSRQWVEESTREHSEWEKTGLKYGYLWWLIDKEERSFAALGDGGNTIYVNPRKNMVISIAALFSPRAGDRIDFIRKEMEPVFA